VKTKKKTVSGRSKFLVFGKPYIGEEEIKEVVDTLRSGWWGTGPKTELFENRFKKYEKAKYAISVNSATAGLHLALKALGVGPGDEVITSSLTFVSDANVIVHCGAKPIFADIDVNTWNIDPKQIEKKITKKTKVIMPVHLHGRPCNMDGIYKIARKYKLSVVNDAAHAIEAKYHGDKIGALGDISVFSFYVTKNLATGEGGMITTNKQKFAKTLPVWRLHGLSRDAWKRYSVKHFTLYEAMVPGFKYNLTDIASSIGIHQLKRIENNLKVRAKIWKAYSDAFRDEPLLTLPAPVEKNTRHGMHLFAILLNLEKLRVNRNTFIDMLIKRNIGSGVHFAPIHTQPYYRNVFGYKKGDYPVTEFVGERIVSLPLGANLTDRDVNDVIRAVKSILIKTKK
jgi:dTDP-4-amino-4,6-dideoxygalactose transaminase